MVLERIMPSVQVPIHLKAYTRIQFLCPSNLKIVLRISTYISHALIGIDGVMPDETGQQGVLDRRRRKESVIGGMQDGTCAIEVVSQPYPRAGLYRSIDKVEVVVSESEINGQIAKEGKMILCVNASRSTQQAAAKRGKHVRVAAAVKKEALLFSQPGKIHACFEIMFSPTRGDIAFNSQGQRRTGGNRDGGDRIGGRKHPVGPNSLVK